MVNPCKGCTDRVQGCHGTCEKYKEWKQNHDEEKEKIQKVVLNDLALDSMERMRQVRIRHSKKNRRSFMK